MKLNIDNNTKLLNEYFFQMLCLVYFHNEKFPRKEQESDKKVSFKLRGIDGGFEASVVVEAMGEEQSGFAIVKNTDMLSDNSDNFTAAAACGRAFLDACSKLFGFLPSWGYLTGIRPAKRALSYLSEGKSEQEIIDIFRNDFSVDEKKAKLCIEIGQAQQNMLAGITPADCSLYIAIPFCPTRCKYCSFVSYSGKKLFDLIPNYLEKLICDLKSTAKLIAECGMRLVSIYIGGGTPTILDEAQLEHLLSVVTGHFDLGALREFTLEAGRPDTITAQKLKVAKQFGVNRVSINPQTLDENILSNIGRKHTTKQFYEAFEWATAEGFSVNADLIAALPGDSVAGFTKSLESVIALKPDNITIHTLTLKNAALLRGEDFESQPNDSVAAQSLERAYDLLGAAGYGTYYLYRQKNSSGNGENCGFALPGKECLYNVLMMEDGSTVFGCGASAVTKIITGSDITRFGFPKYPYEYLSDEWYDKGVFESDIIALIKQ